MQISRRTQRARVLTTLCIMRRSQQMTNCNDLWVTLMNLTGCLTLKCLNPKLKIWDHCNKYCSSKVKLEMEAKTQTCFHLFFLLLKVLRCLHLLLFHMSPGWDLAPCAGVSKRPSLWANAGSWLEVGVFGNCHLSSSHFKFGQLIILHTLVAKWRSGVTLLLNSWFLPHLKLWISLEASKSFL